MHQDGVRGTVTRPRLPGPRTKFWGRAWFSIERTSMAPMDAAESHVELLIDSDMGSPTIYDSTCVLVARPHLSSAQCLHALFHNKMYHRFMQSRLAPAARLSLASQWSIQAQRHTIFHIDRRSSRWWVSWCMQGRPHPIPSRLTPSHPIRPSKICPPMTLHLPLLIPDHVRHRHSLPEHPLRLHPLLAL